MVVTFNFVVIKPMFNSFLQERPFRQYPTHFHERSNLSSFHSCKLEMVLS
ncbi:hypothetical protein NC653_012208 [Populus alba x Populus x berolinensis]|uniref:Uncharacterized protein n=1 Tax=Populus alba x Populus x berolinensis TaxID=444605 RepID=A0AAD6W7V6_9ROSI|nr:hypothetical protein NC653_012208 [Populus alba x Populus x berolinensis]